MEKTARTAETALNAVQAPHPLSNLSNNCQKTNYSGLIAEQQQQCLERAGTTQADARVRELALQRDAIQRERARLQEQLSSANAEAKADAKAAAEREHGFAIRVAALEQQLQSSTSRFV